MNMASIKANTIYKIVGYNTLDYRRYFELGFMLESKILLIKFSILNKSMLVNVDGITYTLRIKNAKEIKVKEI